MTTQSKMRLALIGCGEHAEVGHAIPLARYKAAHPEEIELAAACDIQLDRAQKFCTQYGFRNSYRYIGELLSREEIDGCITVVPPERISEVGAILLERRIPCVVEKPLGSTLTEVNALCATAASSGTPNLASVNRRFMPFLNRGLRWARNAGPIRFLRSTIARHARSEPEFIWATAVHAVDTLRYIEGEVAQFEYQPVRCRAGSAPWYTIQLHFQRGAEGRVDVLPTTGMLEETYELFGDGFRVSVTCPFGRKRGWLAHRQGAIAEEEVAPSDMPEDVLNGCYDETTAFIEALRSGRALNPTIADVAPSVEICMSIAKSLGLEVSK
jgi:myo-inositol 2-dehydrogenase / D-chiro-inositol 1-dehydrogenase